jgi:phosphatidylserine/phosphatidylglycerophosphate/cardiolipin synthase-like enzyme
MTINGIAVLFGLGTSIAFGASVPARVDLCFTPGDTCIPRIVSAIASANSRIFVQGYTFGLGPIPNALVAAKSRGVEIRVILDRSEYELGHSRGAAVLLGAGIPVQLDGGPGGYFSIAHTKAIMIDDELTIGGSFNYSEHAEKDSVEDAAFMYGQELTGEFEAAWSRRWAVSVPLRQ